LPNLIGIELLNEPNPPHPHAFFHDWYRGVISALRRIDARIPLYAGDSWSAHDYAGMLVSAETDHPGFLALDHHLYRCFTPADQAQSAAQLAAALRAHDAGTPSMFAQVNSMMAPVGAGLVVGEWSGALNPASLRDGQDAHAAQREFVTAQLELFERECAGWFWWTYKKQWAGDTGWCFRDAVGAGVFPAWVGMRRERDIKVDGGREWRRGEAKRKAFGACTLVALWSDALKIC
jgi:glucan 1,3-beta-glucosidase